MGDHRAELTWRRGPARMRRSTEATRQGRAWPTRGTGGADTLHEATQVAGGLAVGGPSG